MGAIGNRFPRQKIRWVDFTWTVHPGTLHFCEQFVLSEMYGSTGDTRTPHFLEWGVPYPHFLGVWQKNNSDFPSYSAHVSPYNIQENVWRLELCPRNRVRAHITRPTSSYLRNRISTARIAHIPCTQRQIHNKYNSIHDSAVHKVDSNMFWPWWRADHDEIPRCTSDAASLERAARNWAARKRAFVHSFIYCSAGSWPNLDDGVCNFVLQYKPPTQLANEPLNNCNTKLEHRIIWHVKLQYTVHEISCHTVACVSR